MFAATVLAAAALAGLSDAGQYRTVAVEIVPAQPVNAIAIRSGDTVLPIEVKGGNALVPSGLPLPWTLSLVRFETNTYTQSDLDQHRPLVVRELGRIRGVLRRAKPVANEQFAFLLWRGRPHGVDEIVFTPDQSGAFSVSAPAGIYQGAVAGEAAGTRIRSAIVVDAGQMTNVGELIAEPTARVSVRVLDAKRHTPIAGAKVTWAPPSALNSEIATILFSRRWSTVTNARGVAVLRSIGPPPIPLRWRVSADGYAEQMTRQLVLRDPQPVSLPDAALRTQATITVRVRLPGYGGAELRNAKIVVGNQDEENPARFVPATSTPLREGDVKLAWASYGRKRLWIENASGKRLLYQDFNVTSETTMVEVALQPVEIHGQVRRSGAAVENAVVRVADPHEAKTVLALATTGADGRYRLMTFQQGQILLYAIETSTPGVQSHALTKGLDVNGSPDYQLDFELPYAGARIRVVDATTGKPLQARVDKRLTYGDGTAEMGFSETDSDGRLALLGFPAGTGHLSVRAPGHSAREVDVTITDTPAETLIQLDASKAIEGRVVDVNGAPIAGAKIAGGYQGELGLQASFETSTDQLGKFRFDSAPEPGTVFYVIAPGHSLGITTLQPDHENIATLLPPGRGGIFLMPGNAPPTKVYMVMAAPAGADYIPLGPLYDLAEANGMRSYQLLGTAKDGSVALPEFLPPGTYNIYVTLRGGTPFRYQRVGTVSLPGGRNAVITFAEE